MPIHVTGGKPVEFSDEHLLRLFEIQFAFFMICYGDGRVDYLSPGGASFFLTSEAAEGRQISDIIPGESASVFLESISEASEEDKPVKKVIQLPEYDENAWYEIIISPLDSKKGKKKKFTVSGRDITEWMDVKNEYKRSEIRLKEILDNCPVPIFVLNNEHSIIYWNKALESYSGMTADNVLGTNLHCEVFYRKKRPCLPDLLLDGLISEIEEWYGKNFAKSDLIEGAYEAEHFFPRIGPEGKWLHFTASVIKGPDDSVIGAIETLEDITRQKKAETKLIESRDKYQGLIEQSPNAFFIVNGRGNYLEVNPAASELLGYTNEEFLKMHISQTVPAEDREKTRERFERFLKTSVFNEEIRLLKKNGDIRDVILKGVFLPDGNYMGIVTDITELKKTGEALIEKEQIFRLLFRAMSEGMAIHELVFEDGKPVDYKITDVNDAYSKILGISAEDAVGSLASELYGTGEPPYLEIYSRVALSGKPHSFEVHYPPIGKYFDISVVSPKKDSFTTIFSDITERKNSEIILKESEEKFREVFNNANDIIALVGITEGGLGKIKAINSQGVRTLGYDEKELLEMDPFQLIDETDREKLAESVKEIAKVHEITLELHLKTKDGSIIPVEVKSRLFSLVGKEVVISVIRDITEKKMARDIEKKAFFQIEDNIRQLATLGDAIRNPLAVIVGLADLEGGDLGEKIKKEAVEINDYITMLDRGWIESEKVRDFLKRHYDII